MPPFADSAVVMASRDPPRRARARKGQRPYLAVRSKIPIVADWVDTGTIGICSIVSALTVDQS